MAGRVLASGFRVVAAAPMAAPHLRRAAVRCAPRAAPAVPRFAARTMATATTGAAEEKEQAGPSSSLITPRTRQVSATESHAVALEQTGWRQTMLKLSGCARTQPRQPHQHSHTHALRSLGRPLASPTSSR